MLNNTAFQLCSLAYVIILIIVYLYKRKYHSLENNIYKYLLFFTIILLITDLFRLFTLNYYSSNIKLTNTFCTIYLLGLFIWEIIYVLYIILLETKENFKSLTEAFTKSNNVKIWLIYSFIGLGLLLALPMQYQTNEIIIFGPKISMLYLLSSIGIIYSLFLLLINKTKMPYDRRIPLLCFIAFIITITILQYKYNNIFIITSSLSLIVVFMYFTLENPDTKYIYELSKLREDAESANKAKTEFLARMSHEIRTPMNAIIGLTDAALSNELPYYIKDDIKNINNAGQVLLELINNILDISKIEEGKMELINNEYNIAEILTKISNIITIRISEKPIKYTPYIDNNIPKTLYGDETKIFQIILNLLNNAVKYTEKGSINLGIECKKSNDIANLIITIKDTGIGIKKEDYNKLFEKFSRVDLEKNQSIEGTGLGLVITKELINLMNGKITFKSVYQEGTEFTVTIPQKIIDYNPIGNIQDIEKTVKQITYFNGEKYKILIVDDNKLNIKVAEKLLNPYKFQITSVNSGLECLNYTKKQKYDLILLDHMMPEMDGIKTLHALKQRANEFTTPVIALTANAISGMKEMYLQNGFDDYLSKPMDPQELDKTLRKILNIKE